jgi:hypothetical protein
LSAEKKKVKKPLLLKVIIILNALMMFLPFLVYYLVTSEKIVMDVVPIEVIFTGIAYIISFAVLMYFISKRNLIAIRSVFIINFLIAQPVGVNGGIVVAVVSIILSFMPQVKSFTE